MTTIPFEEFKKLDLRIGQITSIEDHPNAEKLYVLKVNLGTETRTLVAGLRQYYKKEELLNKKIVVITNLEPAVLRGIKSEGMLLAAADETTNNVTILQPEHDIASGSVVR